MNTASSGSASTRTNSGSENCLAIGTRLADFEITGVLGEGGFGIVYLAFDHSLQRTVAIKEYMPGVLAARGADHSVSVRAERHQDTFNVGLKSFINEARFLAQFDHPSLVKVYRYWEQNRTAYTAMQYYDGRTIKDIVARNPELVTQQWCLSIMGQILGALELLGTMNIVHRDVSPDNIIVQDNGDAVLLDFGSARQIIGESTRGLTVILKPGYAPVEQYAGDASLEQGPYTDIYALAAVMYFAIVGGPPATSIARMVKDPLTPLRERELPGYSSDFCGALDAGLAVLAAQRPQSIEAFRALLGIDAIAPARPRPVAAATRIATVEHLPAAMTTTPVTVIDAAPMQMAPTAPVQRRGKGGRMALLLVAAVGAMCAVGYALLGNPGDTIQVAHSQQHGAPASATTISTTAAVAPAPSAAIAPATMPVIVPDAASASASASAGASTGASTIAAEAPAVRTDQPDAAVEAPSAAPAPEAPKPRPAAVDTATYRLALSPWGTVYVDGKQRGVSPPMKKLTLSAGTHTIKVVNPSFPDHTVVVTVTAKQGGAIEHVFGATSR